ncbi:MAG: hypothetical protein GWN48_09225, partial [Actinobacteria bacterium]|nr:hypothetical protein [Actinomycetota bacterium]
MNLAAALLAAIAFQAGAPDSVVVRPAELELAVGATRGLTYRAFARGRPVADAPVRWTVSDPAVLRVDADGRVTALRPGQARVAVVVGGRPAFATVIVPQLPPASIEASLPVARVLAGTGAPLDVTVHTRLGDELPSAGVRFASADESIATVDAAGRVHGVRPGRTTVTAAAGDATARIDVRVAENPAASYTLTAPSMVRTGDVVRLRIRARTRSGDDVSGLRPLWTVAGAGAQIEAEGEEGVFVAEDAGRYVVTAAVGPEVVRTAVVEVEPRDVHRGFDLVGRGATVGHHAGDTWVWEGVDGRDYALIGTFMHDWAKVFDVTDPSHPVLTDSLQLDARRINDVKIHPNNRIGIVTREGASDRRNGIVLLDLADPAHPTILSEYTETVTGGVHNVWILGEHDLVYACHNGTSDVHIIDIADPRAPREVGRWGLDKESKTLHDVIVQDGYAYLSYWDDGVVILDVGAGTHGGTPEEPAFVSQYRYPEGNTHVAWRHGRYLFVGDEIFPADWDPSRPIEARGYIHVLDMTDIENPREVARYEVPEAGAHNVWVEDDVLYVGYYQAGLRVVDVSGELRGDL